MEDLALTVSDIGEETRKLPQKYSDLWEVFRGVRNKKDEAAYELQLADRGAAALRGGCGAPAQQNGTAEAAAVSDEEPMGKLYDRGHDHAEPRLGEGAGVLRGLIVPLDCPRKRR